MFFTSLTKFHLSCFVFSLFFSSFFFFELTPQGIPDEFKCPITYDIMKDPVILPDGRSYESCAMFVCCVFVYICWICLLCVCVCVCVCVCALVYFCCVCVVYVLCTRCVRVVYVLCMCCVCVCCVRCVCVMYVLYVLCKINVSRHFCTLCVLRTSFVV